MTADGNGCQGIVDAEFTRNINLNREVQKSLHMVGNSKISFSSHKFCIFCTKIRFFRKSVSFKSTGVSLHNPVKMLIVTVYDTDFTLFEKHGFAVKIIVKILMLFRSDMIRFNIGKDTKIKDEALGSVKHQSL